MEAINDKMISNDDHGTSNYSPIKDICVPVICSPDLSLMESAPIQLENKYSPKKSPKLSKIMLEFSGVQKEEQSHIKLQETQNTIKSQAGQNSKLTNFGKASKSNRAAAKFSRRKLIRMGKKLKPHSKPKK